MKDVITPIVLAVVLITVIAGGFVLHRWWNYNMPFGYEDQVRDTICATVKPEALQPGACRD
jgi:hypothetical protein